MGTTLSSHDLAVTNDGMGVTSQFIADGLPVLTPGAAAVLARMIRQAIASKEADAKDQPQ